MENFSALLKALRLRAVHRNHLAAAGAMRERIWGC